MVREDLAEPDRLATQLLADVARAPKRAVPLVEQQVEHLHDAGEAAWQLAHRRHLELDAGLAQRLTRSDQALGDGLCVGQERARDLVGLHAAERAQR
jgi:hypothetical protein